MSPVVAAVLSRWLCGHRTRYCVILKCFIIKCNWILLLSHLLTSCIRSRQLGLDLGPSSPGSRDRRHRVYRSIRSRQPGLNLVAFQSWQPEQHSNFPVSLSPVILFHQPYSSQSIVTCMPTSHMNCIWKHCLLLTENCTRRNFLQFCVTVLFILVPQPLLITSFETNV